MLQELMELAQLLAQLDIGKTPMLMDLDLEDVIFALWAAHLAHQEVPQIAQPVLMITNLSGM
jgi:hypothetical protein